MQIKVGDLVTRASYNHDTIFEVVDIIGEVAYLKGATIRLCADSPTDDLQVYESNHEIELEEKAFLERVKSEVALERDDYFYLPGKILHIDGDGDYLDRCLKYYEEANIWAVGVKQKEHEIGYKIVELLNEHNPNILVITGHDAYYRKKGEPDNLDAYKNSVNFVKAVKEARKYEKSHDKLIIIAGACQSNYEALIRSGANFASSPKRINIHALDPAIIASRISLSDVTADIDVKGILEKTKYGAQGLGGLKTKGTMYVGYPR